MNKRTRPILNPDLQRLGDALLLGMHMLESGARQSGRSTRMLRALTPEHRVIVLNERQKQHLTSELRRQGRTIRSVVIADPSLPLFEASNGAVLRGGTWPTLPDHTWVEARLRHLVNEAIQQVQYELDQVDLPVTDEQVRASRQNFLSRSGF